MPTPETPAGGSGMPRDFGEAFASTPDTEASPARWAELTPTLGNVSPNVLQPAPPADTSEGRTAQTSETAEVGIGSLHVDSPAGVPGSMAEVWDATHQGLEAQGQASKIVPSPIETTPPATPIGEPAASASQPEGRPRPTPRERLIHSRQHIAGRRTFFPQRGPKSF